MATFTYTARSRAGEKIAGQIEAGDRRTALLQIERLGHIPVAVEEKAVADARPKEPKRWRLVLRRNRAQRMSMREALLFTTEMGDLLASGMKLGNALNTLAQRRTHKDSDQIIAALRDDIIHGTSLSDALSKHKTSFSTFYVSLIKAGEASGALPEVMQRLVKHYEQAQEVRDKVVTAMVYPCFVLAAGVATM
ncbi:MAG: type II secretion system F family protein, partial [Lentisphaerae bacterium]|nr:type II secretion system F family protein [Lentisphaerota bacterium]